MPVATTLLEVSAPTLGLRSQPQADAPPDYLVLHRGDAVQVTSPDPAGDAGWRKVVCTSCGALPVGGWATTTDVAASMSPLSPQFPQANARFWDLTMDAVERRVGYKFEAGMEGLDQHPPVINCARWVAHLLQEGLRSVNAWTGATVFREADLRALDTYSDELVRTIYQRTQARLTGTELTPQALRPGMVIGVDDGPRASKLNVERPWGIDHVVLVVRNPRSEVLYVTQSTSDPLRTAEGNLITGGQPGVCALLLDQWLALASKRGLFKGRTGADGAAKPSLYAVNALGLADPQVA